MFDTIKFRILEVMRSRGFRSRKALAEKASIPPWRLGAYAKGDVSLISVETLKKLCRTLKCQPGDLLAYEGPDAEPEAPSLDMLIRPGRKRGFIEYETAKGTGFGNGLYADEDVAVQRAFFAKGAVLPMHQHEETEILVGYQGKFRLRFGDDSEREYMPGEVALILPGVPHQAEMIEDLWVIGVTVPGSPGYPGMG